MDELKFSILLPAYNGQEFIAETLKSIFAQRFTNYEIIIIDDNSQDDTIKVVNSLGDTRIRLYKNHINLGYSANLRECYKKTEGDIIYLMGQDDVLGRNALIDTYNAFQYSDNIGAVARPYYWFDNNINTPVRIKRQLNPDKDEIVRISDPYHRIIRVFESLDQLSGLAFRRKYMDLDFHNDIFPCHVYPFASIFKKQPVVFLKDYTVAVRIRSSQCRKISSIYEKSPLQSWVDLFNTVFYEPKFHIFRDFMIKNFVAINYVGLVQIRNYARYRYLFREIWLLIKYRPKNITSLKFWFFTIGCLLTPASLLISLVDWYKDKINSRLCRRIKFDYSLT